MDRKEQLYQSIQDRCILVSGLSWDGTGDGLDGESFVLCDNDRDDFLDQIHIIVNHEEHPIEGDLDTPGDFFNAFQSVIDDYHQMRAPSIQPQVMKNVITESGAYSWQTVELEGIIDKIYHE